RVTDGAQDLCGDLGAAARMAVGDDLRSRRRPDERLHLLARRGRRELEHVHVPRAGDVALPRVARCAGAAVELLQRADVADDEARLAEPAGQLLEIDVVHPRTSASSAFTSSGRSSETRWPPPWTTCR